MIIFLNFAPIEFMGGAERWMYKIAGVVSAHEEVKIFSLHPSIANIYGKIVLGRKFDNRSSEPLDKVFYIGWKAFVPFTKERKMIKQDFKNARLVYFRYEIIETIILLVFGGLSEFKKAVAGIHTPLIYPNVSSFFEWLHKLFYESFLSKRVLKSSSKVHVLNGKDKHFLEEKFGLSNVTMIPNGVDLPQVDFSEKILGNNLRIIFVGELILRKGVDILCEVIRQTPAEYFFEIVGNGSMEEQVVKLAKERKNVRYHGFLNRADLQKLYRECDVLFLPSRAESMSLVILESMSFGLKIVTSRAVALELPEGLEYRGSTPDEYLSIFGQLLETKQKGRLDKQKTRQYCEEHFAQDLISNQLLKKVFQII